MICHIFKCDLKLINTINLHYHHRIRRLKKTVKKTVGKNGGEKVHAENDVPIALGEKEIMSVEATKAINSITKILSLKL